MAEDIIIRYRAEVEDLKRKVDGLIDQQEKLQRSVDDTDKEFQGATKSADKFGDELSDIGKKGDGLKQITNDAKTTEKSFTTLGKTIARIGTGIAAALGTAAFAQFARNSVKAASDFEALTVSFETFLGSAEKAEKVIGDLDKFSIRTPFSPEEVQQAGKALLAFGVQSEDLIETLRRIGDVSAATGKNFNELAVIYGKAKTQGTLFAEDINQLTEAGIPIIEELAEQFGVAEGEVKKLGSEGKLTFENLEQGFKNLTSEGGRFFGLTDRLADTTTGKLSTLEGKVTELQRAFGRNLLPIVNGLAKAAGDIIDAFLGVEKAADDAGAQFDELNGRFQLLTGTLKNGNLTVDQRRKLINQINEEYKEYLPNLLTEKTSLEELEGAIKAVNDQLIQRAVLARAQAEITELTSKIVDAQSKLYDIQIQKEKIRQAALNDTNNLSQQYEFQLQQLDQAEKVNQATIESNTDALNNLQLKYGDLIKQLTTLGKTDGGAVADGERQAIDLVTLRISSLDDLLKLKRSEIEINDKVSKENLKNIQEELNARDEISQKLFQQYSEALTLTDAQKQAIERLIQDVDKALLGANDAALQARDILFKSFQEEVAEIDRTANTTDQANAEKQLAYERYVSSVEGVIKRLGAFESEESEKTKEQIIADRLAIEEAQRAGLRATIDAAVDLSNELTALYSAITDSRIQQLDREFNAVRENYNREQEALETSRENRLITQEEFNTKSAELERKLLQEEQKANEEKNKLLRKQAIVEKANAVFQIGINTEQAISRALAEYPFPFSTIVAGIVGALAAVSLATVIATPIPKFAKGTKGKKDSGMAIVGEEGPEMTFLPQGSKVLPAKQTKTYGAVFDAMYDNRFDDYVLKEFVTPALQEQKRKYEQVQNERFADNVAHSITVSNSGLYWDLENIRKKGQRVVNADDIGRAVAKEVGKVIQSRRRQ